MWIYFARLRYKNYGKPESLYVKIHFSSATRHASHTHKAHNLHT